MIQAETQYLIHEPGESYHALESFDLLFSKQEVKEFIFLWEEGHSLKDITRYMKKHNHRRTFNEMSLLLFDLFYHEKVKQRKKGIKECFT